MLQEFIPSSPAKPADQHDKHNHHGDTKINISEPERVASLIGGAALAVFGGAFGLTRRNVGGLASRRLPLNYCIAALPDIARSMT